MTTVFVLQLLSWSTVFSIYHADAGIVCYTCDTIPHPRDCDTITECGSREQCFAEKKITADGIIYYKTGCKATQACNNVQPFISGLGKRQDITACSKCCNSSYCNINTCDIPIASFGVRCVSCNYVMHPEDCKLSIMCGPDEVCYTQTILHNFEKRYRLGCVQKQQCNTYHYTFGYSFGRRQVNGGGYCGECCETDNCNRGICSEHGSQSQSSMYLKQPPLMYVCRDNSTTYCSENSHRCHEINFKFYQCPYTCRQCNLKPPTTAITKSTTAMTTVALDATTNKPTIATTSSFGSFQCSGPDSFEWNGTCYSVTNLKKPWNSGYGTPKDPCEQMNMTRAILDTDRKINAASFFVRTKVNHARVWIGGLHGPNRGWHWVSGQHISDKDFHWTGGHASTAHHSMCMVLENGQWTSSSCSDSHYHLCERRVGGPVHPTALSTPRPSFITDLKQCTGSGYFQWEDHCYFLTSTESDSKSTSCHDLGMLGTSIGGEKEQRAVVFYVRNVMKYTGRVWLSGYKSHGSNGWIWNYGHGVDIHSNDKLWKPGEPNSHHRCVSLEGIFWVSEDCDHTYPHVCEYHMHH